jgi:hypothetical protein
MKFLKKLSCAAAVALSFAGAAHAGPVLNDWKFNPAGHRRLERQQCA